MLKNRKATLTYVRERMDKGSGTVLVLTAAGAVALATAFLCHAVSLQLAGYFSGLLVFTFLASFVRPIISMASDGYEAILQVTLAVWLLIVVAIAAWCTIFYLVNDGVTSASGGLKILDFPTLIVAIGAACTGWYVHFQMTRRAHRMSHAVSLVLGSRTNAEFQKHNERVRRFLPNKEAIDSVDIKYFETAALRAACEAYNKGASEETRSSLRCAKAVESLKYMLNYYEFMAVGVKLGDIEESIIYETIGAHVCALYDRSAKLREWSVAPEGGRQFLCYEYLEGLAKRWKIKLVEDEAQRKASMARGD